VFEHFTPTLPGAYTGAQIVLLANIAPKLQSHVLDQMNRPLFTIADTMDLWINIAREDLEALIKRVDMLILNDGEARQFTGETSLIKAGHKIRAMGPRFVAIKKGEHGCLLFGEGEFFSCAAYPLEDIHDPTGAGDTFAGGLAGHLAAGLANGGGGIDFARLRQAVVYGSVLASYNVEAFSLERLRSIKTHDIDARYQAFRALSQFEAIG
jgi:sugar/nucleoside kinase (ribokinase family)